jgi:hypothetical protein|tara:strand:- start:87 stop:263 length:177 start_codon:yes stop_codon:yes gene_type:complete
MTTNEKKFVLQLLVLESDGLPEKERSKILKAYDDGLVNMNNLQVCLDRIQQIRVTNVF